MSGTIRLRHNYNYISGTINAGTSVLYFIGSINETHYISPGNITYNSARFGGCNENFEFSGATFTLNGDLSLESACTAAYLNNGTVTVAGNLSLSTSGASGTAYIKLNGAAPQSITGVSSAKIGHLEIASSNTVALNGTIKVEGHYTYTSGTINAGVSALMFDAYINYTRSLKPGAVNYYNVTFGGCTYTIDLNGETFNINGLLTIQPNCSGNNINNGILAANSNVSISGLNGGTTQLHIKGGSDSSLSVAISATAMSGNIIVNKSVPTAKLSLAGTISTISFNSAGQLFDLQSGTVDMAGKNLTVRSLTLNSNTLTKSSGTLTVNGSVAGTGALYGGTVNP